MPVIIVIAAIALFAAVGYFGYLAAKKRREALAALALELGWSFSPGRDRDHDDEYEHFEIFRRGHSRAAYNTMTGVVTIDDRPFHAKVGDFTYKVTQHTGKSTQTVTYRFSYAILHLPFPTTPNLLIRREGMFDKIAGVFGLDDIDFESAEFSKRFYVKGADKRFAYDIVHPRMMEFLLGSDPPTVDIEYGRCCLSDGRHRWSPEEFRARLGWVEKFFDHWPDHVTAELQA